MTIPLCNTQHQRPPVVRLGPQTQMKRQNSPASITEEGLQRLATPRPAEPTTRCSAPGGRRGERRDGRHLDERGRMGGSGVLDTETHGLMFDGWGVTWK